MSKHWRRFFAKPRISAIHARLLLSLVIMAGLFATCRMPGPRPPRGRVVRMEVTSYCPCGKCCGWKRNWFGRPVYASGPLKGKRKRVGICADGTKARKGTIAADTRYYPFGTRMYVPGYGYGVVHDRGSKIRGPNRIDVFLDRHNRAMRWGRQRLEVTIIGR